MTKENSKKLYEHYVEVGYTKAAEDMLKKYPDFKAEEKPKKSSKKEEKEE